MQKVQLNIIGYVVLDEKGANANPQGKIYASKKTAKNLLSKVEAEAQAKAEAEAQVQAEREARYRAEAERILLDIRKYWDAVERRNRAIAAQAKTEPKRKNNALRAWRG